MIARRLPIAAVLLLVGACSRHIVEAATGPSIPITIQSTRFNVDWDIAVGPTVEGHVVVQNLDDAAAGQSATVRCEGRPKGQELLVWSDSVITSQLGPTGTEELTFYGRPTRDGELDITCAVTP